MRRLLIQQRNRLRCWSYEESYFATLGFLTNVWADWKPAIDARTDDQTVTMPRDLLICRQGRVPELASELLRRTLLADSDLPAVHNDVVVVFDTVDPDRSERKVFKEHYLTPV